MTDFFDNIDYETAVQVRQLSQLIFELRDNRNTVLKPYDAENEAALLQKIRDGAVAEHPAYEHYLAARILENTRETVRSVISEHLQEANQR